MTANCIKIIIKWSFIPLRWSNCDSGCSQIQFAVNGSYTHFVQQVSATPIIVDPIAVADVPCERALGIKV